MLRLELISNTRSEVVYKYFPEQKEEYGTISINMVTGEPDIRKLASGDEHRRYLSHAVARIEKYLAEKIFPDSDVVAWY